MPRPQTRRAKRAFAVHPGVIVTGLVRHLDETDWAATSPDLAGQNGLYLEDCGIGTEVASGNYDSGHLAHARDAGAARRLWQVSEEIVGGRFEW